MAQYSRKKKGGRALCLNQWGQWGECCSAGADIENRRGKAVSRMARKYHIQSLQGSREFVCGEAVPEQESSQEDCRRTSEIKDTEQCFQKM